MLLWTVYKSDLSSLAEIWLDWLKDEIRLTEEEPNREKVYELFEMAVKDYICEFCPHLLDCVTILYIVMLL